MRAEGSNPIIRDFPVAIYEFFPVGSVERVRDIYSEGGGALDHRNGQAVFLMSNFSIVRGLSLFDFHRA
jgi:hypothetical protein